MKGHWYSNYEDLTLVYRRVGNSQQVESEDAVYEQWLNAFAVHHDFHCLEPD